VLREVAERGSISAAARTLHLSQPAVSRQVALLERESGAALLHRAARGVVLTDAGAALLEHAEPAFAHLAAAAAQLEAVAGLEAGRVRLSAFPSAGATFVTAAIGEFLRAHPGITVEYGQGTREENVRRLISGELDLAVVFRLDDEREPRSPAPGPEPRWHGLSAAPPDPGEQSSHGVSAAPPGPGEQSSHGLSAAPPAGAEPRWHGLAVTPLADDELCVLLPAGHPLASSEELPLAALAGEGWIAGSQPAARRLLRRAGLAGGFEPRVASWSDDGRITQGLVAAGVGVALLPAIARGDVGEGLVWRRLRPRIAREVAALTLPANRRPPAVAALLELLAERARALAA
jgi:DNA-binding transcriptional LysR family regulator